MWRVFSWCSVSAAVLHKTICLVVRMDTHAFRPSHPRAATSLIYESRCDAPHQPCCDLERGAGELPRAGVESIYIVAKETGIVSDSPLEAQTIFKADFLHDREGKGDPSDNFGKSRRHPSKGVSRSAISPRPASRRKISFENCSHPRGDS